MLKVNKYTTLTTTLSDSATSATLTSAAFDNGNQVPLIVDYDNPSKLEVIWADISGTSLTNIKRAKDGSAAVEHTGTPKICQGPTLSSDDYHETENGGWLPAFEAWTYASATTITVPAGAVSKYAVGDKIKLTQTTVKYFYVTAVADTVLTITGGSDYTLANAAITNNYYSHSNPVGFPDWFNWVPTLSAYSNMTYTSTSIYNSKFKITGRSVLYQVFFTGTIGGTPNPYVGFTLPINRATIAKSICLGSGRVAGGVSGVVIPAGDTDYSVAFVHLYNLTNWTAGVANDVNVQGSYQI